MHFIYAHLIGDYIIQNDWMAQNKKKSDLHCAIHVVTYMIPFLLCGLNWWQMLLIAAQHYHSDRTNFVGWFMEIKGSKMFRDGPLFPWSWVVVDNVIHILWMAFVVHLGKFYN
jgi:hypothetical protein